MSNLTDDLKFVKTPRGSVRVTVDITLNPSGMARFHGKTQTWVMRDDGQVIGNLMEVLRQGRKLL